MSARRLLDRSLPLGSVEALLTRHALPPGALVVELTDTDPRISLDELERRLTALNRLGVRIALDGFGSGYAAITALRRLPVDILKLDRSLVEGVVESPGCARSPAGCCASPAISGSSPSPRAWISRNRSSRCGRWAAPTGRAWRSRVRWTSTGCAGRSLPATIRYRTHRPNRPSRAGVRGCTQGACPLSSEVEVPFAHIMRLPSHLLDTWCVPGEGQCHAHPNSRTWTARRLNWDAPDDDPENPSDLTDALPSLALRHEGFFVA